MYHQLENVKHFQRESRGGHSRLAMEFQHTHLVGKADRLVVVVFCLFDYFSIPYTGTVLSKPDKHNLKHLAIFDLPQI